MCLIVEGDLMEKPAIEGGTPVRKDYLPYHKPSIGDEEINEVVSTLRTGWITTGPKTKKFEERFKEYIGSKYAVAVNSCTAALHLSLVANDISKGDEIITTPYTFAATGEVIIQTGAKPVFVDIDRGTYNIDSERIKEAITYKTKAIIPVHFGGQPCDMKAIIDIAEDHHLLVIEDAAHAMGSEYDNRKIGTIGDLTTFSFYATKNITTAEGGMVTTNDKKKAEKIQILSLHGISKDAWKRYTSQGSWYYEILYAGYKYNMTDIQAAIGLAQLRKVDDFNKIRNKYAEMYNHAFRGFEEIDTPEVLPNVKHAWHLYPLRIKYEMLRVHRNGFIESLRKENIGVSVHFIPLHLHPFYRETFGFKPEDFPISYEEYLHEISLPLYPNMSEADVHDVIEAVKKLIEWYRK